MEPFLPWWLGAAALGLVAAGFRWTLGRPLGVSGSLHKVVDGRRTLTLDAAREAMAHDAATQRALMEATLEAFTPEQRAAAMEAMPAGTAEPVKEAVPPLSFAEHLGVVAGALLGGLLASSVGLGHVDVPAWMLQGNAGTAAAVAVGVLVGLGARLMGGCTSGHGLHGCSSLRTDSVVCTVLFLGTGVAVAMLWGAP